MPPGLRRSPARAPPTLYFPRDVIHPPRPPPPPEPCRPSASPSRLEARVLVHPRPPPSTAASQPSPLARPLAPDFILPRDPCADDFKKVHKRSGSLVAPRETELFGRFGGRRHAHGGARAGRIEGVWGTRTDLHASVCVCDKGASSSARRAPLCQQRRGGPRGARRCRRRSQRAVP